MLIAQPDFALRPKGRIGGVWTLARQRRLTDDVRGLTCRCWWMELNLVHPCGSLLGRYLDMLMQSCISDRL